MLTQISLMPASRRCFGNPSSIVPSRTVCTKHRALCTQQTLTSRGKGDPFDGIPNREASPLRICATGQSSLSIYPLSFRRSLSSCVRDTVAQKRFAEESSYLASDGPLAGAPREAANTRAVSSVSFVCPRFSIHPSTRSFLFPTIRDNPNWRRVITKPKK